MNNSDLIPEYDCEGRWWVAERGGQRFDISADTREEIERWIKEFQLFE